MVDGTLPVLSGLTHAVITAEVVQSAEISIITRRPLGPGDGIITEPARRVAGVLQAVVQVLVDAVELGPAETFTGGAGLALGAEVAVLTIPAVGHGGVGAPVQRITAIHGALVLVVTGQVPRPCTGPLCGTLVVGRTQAAVVTSLPGERDVLTDAVGTTEILSAAVLVVAVRVRIARLDDAVTRHLALGDVTRARGLAGAAAGHRQQDTEKKRQTDWDHLQPLGQGRKLESTSVSSRRSP